jgi:DNA-directed RNA polymerase subunit M/transcription elongation factor TFIIS
MTCPDCIEIMTKETRIAGKFKGKRVFLVCPKCGYNVPRAYVEYYDEQELEIYENHLYEQQHGNNDIK